jgi:hypothetical protein
MRRSARIVELEQYDPWAHDGVDSTQAQGGDD